MTKGEAKRDITHLAALYPSKPIAGIRLSTASAKDVRAKCCASGATVHSKAELKALVADADKLLKEYKANNKGWL